MYTKKAGDETSIHCIAPSAVDWYYVYAIQYTLTKQMRMLNHVNNCTSAYSVCTYLRELLNSTNSSLRTKN